MRPNFALNLSYDGIGLLLRAKGGWRRVGEVSLDDPELPEKLKFLRRTATEMSGGQFATKLVIPNSQILFRDVYAPGDSPGARRVAIRAALDGTTPYALDELIFDWSDAEDGMAKVAVVAAITLQEAETFAAEHRFNPVAFVAAPEPGDFTGEPWFGTTRLAKGLLSNGETVERDTDPIVVLGSASASDLALDAEDELDGLPASIALDEAPLGAESDQGRADSTVIAVSAGPDTPPDTPLRKIEVHRKEASLEVSPQTPHLESAVAAMSFSTRRATSKDDQPDQTPARLGNMAPRIAILANPEPMADSDGLPKLGAATRNAEVTHLSVTAPETANDDRPARSDASLGDPYSAENPTENAAAQSHAPKASATSSIPKAPKPLEPVQVNGASEGKNVFGARNKAAVRKRPRYLGLVLTLALILALAAAAWLSELILGEDSVVMRMLRPSGPSNEVTASTLPENAPIEMAASQTEPVITTAAPSTPAVPALTVESSAATLTGTTAAALDPIAPIDPDSDQIEDIYIASIDPVVVSHDAVAVPEADQALTDIEPAMMQSPTPAGTAFDLDERGLVRALPDGALTPDGVTVYAGKPAVVPSPRPETASVARPEAASAVAALRPIARPDSLVEQNEKSRFGGRTLEQMAALRPVPRPASAQDSGTGAETPPTKFAVVRSLTPASRPSDITGIVERAVAEAQRSEPAESVDNTVLAAASVAAPKLPPVPTRTNVATEATVKNAIDLGKINLIGVYGSSANRRALIRLSSGRYVKVQVGDKIDGGQVAAISASEVLYVKSGRKVTLEMPKS